MQSNSDNIELIDELIEIKLKRPHDQTPEDYERRNEITKQLFGTISLHDAFANKNSEFCLKTVIWIDSYGKVDKIKTSGTNKLYSSNGSDGSTIRVHPHPRNLFKCITKSAFDPKGAYLYFESHSNIVWIDPRTRIINRYDPQISKESSETIAIDSGMVSFFSQILPGYKYLGNTLSGNQLIQNVLEKKSGAPNSFCQEYTLMYADNRLDGMNHLQASMDLVKNADVIEDRIREFYVNLL